METFFSYYTASYLLDFFVEILLSNLNCFSRKEDIQKLLESFPGYAHVTYRNRAIFLSYFGALAFNAVLEAGRAALGAGWGDKGCSFKGWNNSKSADFVVNTSTNKKSPILPLHQPCIQFCFIKAPLHGKLKLGNFC